MKIDRNDKKSRKGSKLYQKINFFEIDQNNAGVKMTKNMLTENF
jgi:hypothetical protein